MVIELSEVQFGLTSNARDYKISQVCFKTKIAGHEVQLPLYSLLYSFLNHIFCNIYCITTELEMKDKNQIYKII